MNIATVLYHLFVCLFHVMRKDDELVKNSVSRFLKSTVVITLQAESSMRITQRITQQGNSYM